MKDAVGRIGSVLVLGGTSDIGVATALDLVRRRGARRVVLAGRDPRRLEAHAEELRSAGATSVDTVELEARERAGHAGLVARLWEDHGDIDVTVFALGVLGDQLRAEQDPDHALEIAEVNYLSALSLLVPVANQLRDQGHGSIVVLSSIAGVQARRANFVYGSTKAGLDAFGLGLGDALAGTGAHVLVVRPGFVHSKMTAGMDEAPFAATPEEVARATTEALDRHANVVHVPRAVGAIGGVLRNLPRPLVRRLPR